MVGMDPFFAWSLEKVVPTLVASVLKSGGNALLNRWQLKDQDRITRRAIELFIDEFQKELQDKVALSAAIEGYEPPFAAFLEAAGFFIVGCLTSSTQKVDIGPIKRMWPNDGPALPGDFDWEMLAKNYDRRIRQFVRDEPELRSALTFALQDQITKATTRLAPLDPGFDLDGYRNYLRNELGIVPIAALHSTAYGLQVELRRVFVPQSASETVSVYGSQRDLLRRLRTEGHLDIVIGERELESLKETLQNTKTGPILDILSSHSRTVVLGDPGAGKTSLLKYLAMRWVTDNDGLFPIWIDLKRYVRNRVGFLKYIESSCTSFGLSVDNLVPLLELEESVLYIDGLDEVVEKAIRGDITSELIAFSSRYPKAHMVLTSRILGYEPERLRNAGFKHATLEDFSSSQIMEFLRKWHELAEPTDSERNRLVTRLERALAESHAIRQLAGNPMLLTMMSILNRNQELPRDRVGLYREASRVLLYDWDKGHELTTEVFVLQDKEGLLRELAGQMQQLAGGLAANLIDRTSLLALVQRYISEKLGITDSYVKAQDLVQRLTERNFILCSADADRFSFVHRSFLEYYCASWFFERYRTQRDLSLEELKEDVYGKHWREEHWAEVLRLIAGMVEPREAEQLIQFLMRQDGRREKIANLMLAAGCLSEVRFRHLIAATDQELKRELLTKGIRYCSPYYYERWRESEECGPIRRKALDWLSIVWRSNETHDLLCSIAKSDADWIIRSAAIGSLARHHGSSTETTAFFQKQFWVEKDARVRGEILRWIFSNPQQNHDFLQKFERNLLMMDPDQSDDPDQSISRSALLDRIYQYRQFRRSSSPYTAVSGPYVDFFLVAQTIQYLSNTYRSDPSIPKFLRHFIDENAEDLLFEKQGGLHLLTNNLARLNQRANHGIRSDTLRKVALDAFTAGWSGLPSTRDTLRGWFETAKNSTLRAEALRKLVRGWPNDPETLALLMRCCQRDKDASIRSEAIKELCRGWHELAETFQLLWEHCRIDSDGTVRKTVIQELARRWLTTPDVSQWIGQCAWSDEDYDSRKIAVQAIARNWAVKKDVVDFLRDRAQLDQSEVVRCSALQEIIRTEKDEQTRITILKEYAESNEHPDLRQTAVHEIARCWSDREAFHAWLTQRVQDDASPGVRSAAIQVLAHFAESDAMLRETLTAYALSGDHPEVRKTAVEEMARVLHDDQSVRGWLVDQVNSAEFSDVRVAALQALDQGWQDGDTLRLLLDRVKSDDDQDVRMTALELLGNKIREEGISFTEITDRVKDKSAQVRKVAIQQLASRWGGIPDTLPLLRLRVCSDESPAVRVAALMGLSAVFETDSGTHPLILDRFMKDESPEVRMAAAAELADLKPTDPETLQVLQNSITSDEDWNVRYCAFREFSRCGHRDENRLIWLKGLVISKQHTGVEYSALREISEFWHDDQRTLPWLHELVQSSDFTIRSTAVEEMARGWRDDCDTFPLLVKLARKDSDERVRRTSVAALLKDWPSSPEVLALINPGNADG